MRYMIEVCLFENNEYDPANPYFWCLKSYAGKEWCTDCAGWAASQEAAWNAALRYYMKYKQQPADCSRENNI